MNTGAALDALQFFAKSANSVRVFEALADGLTTSRELAEYAEASRSTVARILDEGESRGWVDSEGSRYELTKSGAVMLDEFHGYRQTVEGLQNLGEAVEWLPSPAHSLDFRHFRDADVITPTPPTPSEPFDYVAEMIRTATELRSLVELAMTRYVKLIDEEARAGRLDAELVIQADWFDSLGGEPEQVPLWWVRAQRDEVWTYDGAIPINMHVFDDLVVIWVGERLDGDRVIRGVVVTETPAVVSWAESLYETYRTEADPLDPAVLPDSPRHGKEI